MWFNGCPLQNGVQVFYGVPVLGLLLFLLFLTSEVFAAESQIPQLGPCIDWSLPETVEGFVHYDSEISMPSFYNFKVEKSDTQITMIRDDRNLKIDSEGGYYHSSDIEKQIYVNPHYLKQIEQNILPLDHPLMPKKTPPQFTFFDINRPLPDLVSLLDVIKDEHFLWLPPNQQIKLVESPAKKHAKFDFPVGSTFIHRISLKSKEFRPLEIRFLQKRQDGEWQPGCMSTLDRSLEQETLAGRGS